jgi:hypothetical protein
MTKTTPKAQQRFLSYAFLQFSFYRPFPEQAFAPGAMVTELVETNFCSGAVHF